ncbi:hypothetical protein VTN00DRAFT_2947 [Thermoascus crustaceus]|uniref:uncharacterized protein n=1 Tax=Thermoascus crustaceus TaxID=5088 RepID=UPI0037442888
MAAVSDDVAKENGIKPEPLSSVPFWHPTLKGVRLRVTRQWAQMNLFLCVFIMAILSLYWSILFRVENNMPSLKVWVVDFDGQVEPYRTTTPLVGPIVTRIAADLIKSPYNQLGYTIRSPADFGYDPMAVRQSIYDEHAYAAVIVNPNATALLEAAVAQGNTSYDPYGAGQIIIISARDQTSYPTYILPSIYTFQFAVSSAFGPAWASRLAQTPSLNLSQVPQAVNPGVAFTLLDLRPFGPPVATPAVTIGLIYLIIISFFSFPFLMPIHMQYAMGDHPPLHFSHMVIWRIMSNIIAYFFLSLCYSLVSLAYQIPFSNPSAPPTQPAANPNAYGKASFFVFWMLNWVGMSALGFPSENMGMILGPPWSALWLIFWVITNVATGFYSLDLAPGFFAWGYAWPLHNIVAASRTILFDTHSRIGLSFGILFAWVGFSIALFPFSAMFMLWKKKRGWS